MILAQEEGANPVIIDDNAAKKTAKHLGLTVTGTLGILLKTKRQGIVEKVSPILSKVKQNGFYTDSRVAAFVLEPEKSKQIKTAGGTQNVTNRNKSTVVFITRPEREDPYA